MKKCHQFHHAIIAVVFSNNVYKVFLFIDWSTIITNSHIKYQLTQQSVTISTQNPFQTQFTPHCGKCLFFFPPNKNETSFFYFPSPNHHYPPLSLFKVIVHFCHPLLPFLFIHLTSDFYPTLHYYTTTLSFQHFFFQLTIIF